MILNNFVIGTGIIDTTLPLTFQKHQHKMWEICEKELHQLQCSKIDYVLCQFLRAINQDTNLRSQSFNCDASLSNDTSSMLGIIKLMFEVWIKK